MLFRLRLYFRRLALLCIFAVFSLFINNLKISTFSYLTIVSLFLAFHSPLTSLDRYSIWMHVMFQYSELYGSADKLYTDVNHKS